MTAASWTGAVRAFATLAVGAGLVVAADQVPGTYSVGAPVAPVVERAPELVPVTSVSLTCPGPETEGLPGIAPVAGTSTVAAALAPAEALQGITLPAGPGALQVRAMPGAAVLGTSDQRTRGVSAGLRGTTVAEVAASGSLAPGLAALQTWVQTEGDDRALVAAPCTPAKADLWLVGGGGESTRREHITLANPGANPVSADVTVLGTAGPLPSANGQDLTVPPHGRVTLLLDALVGPEKTPVVHVEATGGLVTAVLEDSWIEGAVGRGAGDAVPSADPSTEQVVPAAFLGGPARLRVAVPGPEEAVVQARMLTAEGTRPLPGEGVVRVPGGSVRDIDLSSLPAGAYAVQVRADHPVVAGAMLERRGDGTGQSDFAWTTSTAPIPVVAGTPLPDGFRGLLMLVAAGDQARATVVTVSPTGAVASKDVTVPADGLSVVDLSGAGQVWVRQTSGTLRAGVSLSLDEKAAGTPLFSIVPLGPSAVSATQVPVREVPR
jgi:hypothetical protein